MYCELYNRDIMNKINCDSTNGYFITNEHVVRNAKYVISPDGT